jgi:hypothetical protein
MLPATLAEALTASKCPDLKDVIAQPSLLIAWLNQFIRRLFVNVLVEPTHPDLSASSWFTLPRLVVAGEWRPGNNMEFAFESWV